jgi:two-component system, NarL family, response regulator
MIRILVVDDHPIMRFGIASIIDGQPGMQVVGQAGVGEEAVELFDQLRPELTLMDLQLPGLGGVAAIQQIRASQPDAKVIVLTTYRGEDDIYQALRAGASGYLVKGMSHEVLIEAIHRVCDGRKYIPSEVSSKLKQRNSDGELSVREREVLALIAKGDGNKKIAAQLGVTEATVKCHVGAILSRWQVEDRTQALVFALQRGFIHFG